MKVLNPPPKPNVILLPGARFGGAEPDDSGAAVLGIGLAALSGAIVGVLVGILLASAL